MDTCIPTRHFLAWALLVAGGAAACSSGGSGSPKTGTAGMGGGGPGAAGDSGSAGSAGNGAPAGAGGMVGSAGQSGSGTGGGSGNGAGSGAGGAVGQAGAGQGAGGSIGQGGMGGDGAPPPTCSATPPTSTAFMVDAGGVTFNVGTGKLRVQVCKDDIIRIAYTTAATLPTKMSLSISNTWANPPTFCVTEASGTATITTARLKAKVVEMTGVVTYTDLQDNVILAEDSKTLTAATVEGTSTFKVQTVFNSPATEALFGLGQHQNSTMNYKGATEHIENANTQINLPLLVSNKGYGVFWDNYSKSDFAGNTSSNTKYTYTSEAGDLVDYYFFYGPSIDQVIANFRVATGAAPMFPRWAYGLFQSKDHYMSTTELNGIRDGYRKANIPLDVIVQDWDYWQPYVWGSHLMDPSRYPDPAALVTGMHSANVHLMISVWPLYQYTATPKDGEMDNYNALAALTPTGLLPTGAANGVYHFYDTFNAMARKLVFKQTYDRLLGKYGWDAIWADNTEPQGYPEPVNVHAATTALGKGAFYLNAYPLEHNRALYEGWRDPANGPSTKRVFVLTRSAFSGQQRFATACWSGDINCTFPTLAKQIPAGLNFAMAGMPYWTTDIGGYSPAPTWSDAANNEMFTRWFQFGSFCPIFRIHGQGSRELYGSQWSATTKANLLKVDKTRYRLMPYIYSLAWKVTSEGYTIMRHLVFDYPTDSMVFGIKDQFMFGPALLVNPVTTAGATSRMVYLPAGTWYDFWTGSTVTGGSAMMVSAPLDTIPLFVRAGSIIPMAPDIQYATEKVDPLEIRVYKGKDASFTLYEDENDTYNYEQGKYSLIPFTWNDSMKQLTIGARTGTYTGMPTTRTFNVVFVGANHGNDITVVATPDKAVSYDGSQMVITAP